MAHTAENQRGRKILVVEDEVLVGENIRMSLRQRGYEVAELAISYEEAIAAISREAPDAVLLDIRLAGQRTGIDVARFIQKLPDSPPFLFLTSQMDDHYLELAKRTHPAGYLEKPVQMRSLLATLKMVLFNASAKEKEKKTMELRCQGENIIVHVGDIKYIRSDHVYAHIALVDGSTLIHRSSISELLRRIDHQRFVRTHRGYAVNLNRVTGYDQSGLFLGEDRVPVSRSRRLDINRLLN